MTDITRTDDDPVRDAVQKALDGSDIGIDEDDEQEDEIVWQPRSVIIVYITVYGAGSLLPQCFTSSVPRSHPPRPNHCFRNLGVTPAASDWQPWYTR